MGLKGKSPLLELKSLAKSTKSERQKKLALRVIKASKSFKSVSKAFKALAGDAVNNPQNLQTQQLFVQSLGSILNTSIGLIGIAEKRYKKTKTSFDMYAYLAVTDQVREIAKEIHQFRDIEANMSNIIDGIVGPALRECITEAFKDLRELKATINDLPQTQRSSCESALAQYAVTLDLGLKKAMESIRLQIREQIVPK